MPSLKSWSLVFSLSLAFWTVHVIATDAGGSTSSSDDGSAGAVAFPPATCDSCALNGTCRTPTSGFIYCGKYYNKQVDATTNCCCTIYEVCQLTDSACNCKDGGPPDFVERVMTEYGGHLTIVAICAAVGVALLILGCVCARKYGCCCGQKKNRQQAKVTGSK